ncbi:hypothetical protein MNBD_NITROSPINAE02-690 [hydrothermal vent metagenome]|uniref:TNase-like domain-containing protein n=1 Tax=hydrothermal vent metagenome TaxID=652676 RepID=A0A3B1CDE5_9ZZZZ
MNIRLLQLFMVALAIIAITSSYGISRESSKKYMWGKVISIQDGDTIVIEDDNGKRRRVQLAYIDAPDMNPKTRTKQPLHDESVKYLTGLLINKEIIIESFGVDKFSRIKGMVFLNKLNVNQEMVTRGFAEIYHPVRKNPRSYIKEYTDKFQEAEKFAKERKIGIWGDADYVSPYQFRRKNK